MKCKYCNVDMFDKNDVVYENCRINWYECPNCLSTVEVNNNKATWYLPKKMKNIFDNLIHEWEETGELTEEYDTAIKFSNSYSENDILVFEFKKDATPPEQLNYFVKGLSELIPNKILFIPMDDMICNKVEDVEFLIKSYEMALQKLKTIKRAGSNDVENLEIKVDLDYYKILSGNYNGRGVWNE